MVELKPLTLTDITEAQARLLDADIPEEDLGPILEGIKTTAENKVSAIGAVIREYKAQCAAIAAEMERLKQRHDVRMRRTRWLQDYLRDNMEALGLDKVETPTSTIRLQRNPPSVEVVDEEAVDPAWWRVQLQTLLTEVPEELLPAITSKTIDARAIMDRWRRGIGPPLGTRIVEDKKHLRMS